ncbi:MAG: Xaa-Pro peptidase family protein [Pseudomonadota bacterium]
MTPSIWKQTSFERVEYEARLDGLQRRLADAKIDAALLNSEFNLEYFSGLETQFPWNSPSRAVHLIVPVSGEPIGIVPEILAGVWRRSSWVSRIETWPSPRPEDEGVREILGVLAQLPRKFGRIGIEMGPESRLGMTVGDLRLLEESLMAQELADVSAICQQVRLIKSPAEIARIAKACEITSSAFAALPARLASGVSEVEAVAGFCAAAISQGATSIPFIGSGSGQGGYEGVVSSPSDTVLREGDVFFIDAGVKYRGYSADFDRNFGIGRVDEETRHLHRLLYDATEAGIAACVPGARAQDVFRAQAMVLEDAGIKVGSTGRLGHGLGKQLTEPPSNTSGDHTELAANMVMTVEPAATNSNGLILVHEENLVVTEDGPRLLSHRTPAELPIIC